MRCFVGIELDPETRAALTDACMALRSADSVWAGEKWVRPENLHMTVAFLGDVEDAAVAAVTEAIADGLEGVTAFGLPFDGLRAVPGGRRVSMLWAAYRDIDGRCASLVRQVAEACIPLGIALEERPFKAHVTLARARRPHHVAHDLIARLQVLSEPLPEFLSVPSATLFSSTLTKTGPIYRPLVTWAFAPTETSS